MIETRVEDQLRQMAPPLLGGGRAFFTEEDLQAAFPRTKNCDAGIDFGGDVVLAEVVSGTVKVQTRELADVGSFVQDAERIVLGKARQLYVTAANLLRRPQPANSPVKVPPSRIFPIVVISGQFPVNPLTIRYISEQLTAEGHRPDGTDPAAHRPGPGRAGRLPGPPPAQGPDAAAAAGRLAGLALPRRRLPQLPRPRDRRPGTRPAGRRRRTPWRNRSKSSSNCSARQAPGHPRKAPRQDVPRNRPGNPAQHRPGYEQIPAANRPARQEAALGTWLALRLG